MPHEYFDLTGRRDPRRSADYRGPPAWARLGNIPTPSHGTRPSCPGPGSAWPARTCKCWHHLPTVALLIEQLRNVSIGLTRRAEENDPRPPHQPGASVTARFLRCSALTTNGLFGRPIVHRRASIVYSETPVFRAILLPLTYGTQH